MRTESKRQIKFANQIKKDLAAIFQIDSSYYFRNTLGTITQVKVSPDLGLAKIYLSIFPNDSAKEIFLHLNEVKKDVRLKLGKKIGKQVRIIPELAFFHDEVEEEASKIDKLIDDLHIPPTKE